MTILRDYIELAKPLIHGGWYNAVSSTVSTVEKLREREVFITETAIWAMTKVGNCVQSPLYITPNKSAATRSRQRLYDHDWDDLLTLCQNLLDDPPKSESEVNQRVLEFDNALRLYLDQLQEHMNESMKKFDHYGIPYKRLHVLALDHI